MLNNLKIKQIKLVKNNTILADKCYVADSFFARLKGLIGEKMLRHGEGLMLTKCNDIHMWFMSISIDVLFIQKAAPDAETVSKIYTVCSTRENLKPWRPIPVRDGAATETLELPVGTIKRHGVKAGDQLCIS